MSSEIKEQVRNHERQLATAIKAGNLTVLNELLHDDLLFLNQKGQIITKVADLETYQSGKLVILEMTPSEQTINIMGETATTTQLLWLKGKYEEQLFAGQFRYLRVWQLSGDHWQVIAGACSLV